MEIPLIYYNFRFIFGLRNTLSFNSESTKLLWKFSNGYRIDMMLYYWILVEGTWQAIPVPSIVYHFFLFCWLNRRSSPLAKSGSLNAFPLSLPKNQIRSRKSQWMTPDCHSPVITINQSFISIRQPFPKL